jgi:2-amino-4-hydroxy-6-hydroxymethyldihydropteridine diphosphokinase
VTRAVLSLGSNRGDRLAHLQSAVDGLGPAVVAVSPVYQTAPWGGVAQGDYLNAVVLVGDPAADAYGWLARAQRLEAAAGRVRQVRWGPRTLDVDVVDVEGTSSADPRLTLPHPHAHERAFVLVPWAQVAPDAVLAGHGRVADLAAAVVAADPEAVRRRDDLRLRGPTGPAVPPGDPAVPPGDPAVPPGDPAVPPGPAVSAGLPGPADTPGTGPDVPAGPAGAPR